MGPGFRRGDGIGGGAPRFEARCDRRIRLFDQCRRHLDADLFRLGCFHRELGIDWHRQHVAIRPLDPDHEIRVLQAAVRGKTGQTGNTIDIENRDQPAGNLVIDLDLGADVGLQSGLADRSPAGSDVSARATAIRQRH